MIMTNAIPTHVKAYGFFFAHLIISSLNDVATKFLGINLPASEVVFLRFLFSVLFLLPLLEGKESLRTTRPYIHLLRAVLLYGGILIWSNGLNFVQITVANVINFTIPFFVLIFAQLILKEKVTSAKWLATIIGFTGVVVASEPFSSKIEWSVMLLLLSAACFALLDVINKKYVVKESLFTMMFYSSLFTTLLATPLAFKEWITPDLQQLLVVALLGLGANLILLFLLKSFALIEASTLSPLRYSEIIISGFLSYLAFGDIPSLNNIIGALIIIPASLFVVLRNSD